jgi:hypothetical protein
MRRGFLCGFLSIACSLTAQNARSGTVPSHVGSFDPPLKKKVVDFGPSPYYPNPKTPHRVKLSCFYYPTFMVKEYDEGQKGAEWLAIVPITPRGAETCNKSRVEGERLINGAEWCGYFRGVKQDFAFFDACDGEDGGLPFGVYDTTTGKKVFEDSAYESSMWSRKAKSPFDSLQVIVSPDGKVVLKYLRLEATECDLRTEKTSCWEGVRSKANLKSAQPPVCTNYEGAKGRWVSVLAYPVEVSLSKPSLIRTISGPLRCWPVD